MDFPREVTPIEMGRQVYYIRLRSLLRTGSPKIVCLNLGGDDFVMAYGSRDRAELARRRTNFPLMFALVGPVALRDVPSDRFCYVEGTTGGGVLIETVADVPGSDARPAAPEPGTPVRAGVMTVERPEPPADRLNRAARWAVAVIVIDLFLAVGMWALGFAVLRGGLSERRDGTGVASAVAVFFLFCVCAGLFLQAALNGWRKARREKRPEGK